MPLKGVPSSKHNLTRYTAAEPAIVFHPTSVRDTSPDSALPETSLQNLQPELRKIPSDGNFGRGFSRPVMHRGIRPRTRKFVTAKAVAITAIVLNFVLLSLFIYVDIHLSSKIPRNDIQRILASWGKAGTITEDEAEWPTDFSRDIVPIPCHSHNDYWRRVPLYNALAAGCTGIEADVWLENGDLFVGHSKASLSSNRSLRSLYVNPLVDILNGQNLNSPFSPDSQRRGIFDTDPTASLTLLVDIKSDADVTLPLLVDQLAPLRSQGYLTHLNGSSLLNRQVTVVGTGNTRLELITSSISNPYRDIFFDAPLDQLWGNEEDPPANASLYTSENSYYASVSFAQAIGSPWLGMLKPSQIEIIRGQVREANNRGLKARYWDTPAWPINLRDHVWNVLVHEGVGMLSVDNLDGAAKRDWGQM
ncbi:MAG: hypothetical protein Q9191_002671 [Dirinaria sp. TL-2023a]